MYKIALLTGDGIGKDVMEAARIILDGIELDAEYLEGDVGWKFWCKEGDPLPERTIELLKESDCCLFGAITSKPKEEAEKELDPKLRGKMAYFSPIVRLRQEFDLYANQRPCKAYEGNPLNYRDDIDLVIFRENTQGLYSGVEWNPVPKEIRDVMLRHHGKMKAFEDVSLEDLAISTRIFTREGCRRIIRKAFEYAKEFNKKSVTIVEKPNVIRETSGMMVGEARKIAEEYPIELWETNVDAMCMWLIKNPQDYSVLVSSNMFGDIISDEAAQLVGGLGFACSGNIGDEFAVFEPTHGSAPKYAGKYVVNPTAMILAIKMMLDWLGEKEMAEKLERSVAEVIKEGSIRTKDMGGSASTLNMAKEVLKKYLQ